MKLFLLDLYYFMLYFVCIILKTPCEDNWCVPYKDTQQIEINKWDMVLNDLETK